MLNSLQDPNAISPAENRVGNSWTDIQNQSKRLSPPSSVSSLSYSNGIAAEKRAWESMGSGAQEADDDTRALEAQVEAIAFLQVSPFWSRALVPYPLWIARAQIAPALFEVI